MQGKATLGNHPIHPMLVALPIGFFAGVLVSDIVSIWADRTFWSTMSEWLIAFGVLAALVAAIFGFVDYFSAPMSTAAKRTATTHMVLNLIVVVCYAAAFFIRYGDATSVLGYVVTYIGLALLLASGWYGGHLVNVHLIGTTAQPPGSVEGRTVGTSRTPARR